MGLAQALFSVQIGALRMNLKKCLKTTLHRRPYHSEADLQHALAWAIKESYQDAEIRLERPFSCQGVPLQLDIWLKSKKKRYAIELKYKVKGEVFDFRGEAFKHKLSGGQPQVLYDYIKDVSRLEMLLNEGFIDEGFAIIVTNEKSYREQPRKVKTLKNIFGIHHGHRLSGRYEWPSEISNGTKKGREAALILGGSYALVWGESLPESSDVPNAHYLIINVK